MKIKFLCTAALVVVGITPPVALAQVDSSASPTPAAGAASGIGAPTPLSEDQRSDGITDIVVTAQRSATSLQRTPISIQVYTGEDLQRRGVADMRSLVQTDSSVNLNLSTGQPVIAIRGVATQNATEVGDPAVSIASDGVFTNRPSGTFAAFYDIDRVEILRGPQGTLFGRNSTGGTINLITARPTDGDVGRITGEYGNYDQVAADGFANFGLAENVNARMSFTVRSRNGFRNNAPADNRGDDEDVKSLRFQVAFAPTDRLSGWLLGQYTSVGGTGPVSQIAPFVFKNGVDGEPVHEIPGELRESHRFPLYAQYSQDLRRWEVRGGLTYDLSGNISINYLGGYDKINYLRVQAQNPYWGGVLNGPGNGTIVPVIYHNRERPETINQEIRIGSSPRDRLFWQVGAYYFRESSDVVAYTEYNPGAATAQRGVEFLYPEVRSSSKALFAQATYALTDSLKLTGGVRYTWDKKSREGSFLLDEAETGLPFTITLPQSGATKSSKPTWLAGVDYQVNPDSLLYAKFSTGYKVGGFNSATSNYGPESVNAYEIGLKNNFLNNHLQLNIAAFRMDYSNQQVAQFLTGSQNTGSQTVNAGKSRIWGVELNTVVNARDLGNLSVSANYTHARYIDFLASAGWDPTINIDFSGNRLPLSPEWSLSGQYQYPIELGSGALITPRVAMKYQSKQFFSYTNYNSTKQGSYALVDAGIDFAPSSKKWLLQAYVKNLFDKTILADATEFYSYNDYTVTYQAPRTYGMRLSYNF